MKVNFENSWAHHPGFEPRPFSTATGILPLGHSNVEEPIKQIFSEKGESVIDSEITKHLNYRV